MAAAAGETDFTDELRESAANGADMLLVFAFPGDTETILQESLDNEIYDEFGFVDSAKRLELVAAIGGDKLGGMQGTEVTTAPGSPSTAAWEASFLAEHGEQTMKIALRETYDAAIALALAAQAAGSVDGAAIRDALRAIGSAPGEVVLPGSDGVAAALRILDDGGDVDYEGAAVTLDWDANGDITRGYIGVWSFTSDGGIAQGDVTPVVS